VRRELHVSVPPEDQCFTVVAAHGATAAEHEVASALSVPKAAMGELFARLEREDVTEIGPMPATCSPPSSRPSSASRPSSHGAAPRQRHHRRPGGHQPEPARALQPQHWRIAYGLANSLARLAHARGVDELAGSIASNRSSSRRCRTSSAPRSTSSSDIPSCSPTAPSAPSTRADGNPAPPLQERLRAARPDHRNLDLNRLEAGELRLDIKPSISATCSSSSAGPRLRGGARRVAVSWDIPTDSRRCTPIRRN